MFLNVDIFGPKGKQVGNFSIMIVLMSTLKVSLVEFLLFVIFTMLI